MSIHAKKRCLIVPEGATPPGWPAGWEFIPGGAMPPGWGGVRVLPEGVRLVVVVSSDGVNHTIRVVDEYNEDTDELNGHLILIEAANDRGPVRVKISNTGQWTKRVLYQIAALKAGGFGISTPLYFEHALRDYGHPDGAQVTIKVFGHE